MAYGFRARSSAGLIQIDQSYDNFALLASGSTTTDTNLGVVSPKISSYKTIAMPAGVISPVIALYSTMPTLIIQATLTSFSVVAYGLMGQAFEWFIFDEIITPPGAGYGIRVRDPASGKVRFDSRLKYMRVVGEGTLDAVNISSTTNWGAIASVPGRKLAAVQSKTGVHQITDGGSGGAGTVAATTWAAGAASPSLGLLDKYSFSAYGFNSSTGFDSIGTSARWLALDVTGF